MKTPFAIALVKLFGNNDEPFQRSRYEEIFTSAGAGKWNMVDYFRDMSHGLLDLSGSKVFGWYQLDKPYTGSGLNLETRKAQDDLLVWARQKLTDDGVHIQDFFSVVVVFNSGADLFGGPNGACCGDDGANLAFSGLSPSFLGQEMGHVYGLAHSRAEGSESDYQDQYDVMSVQNAFMAPHPIYQDRVVATGIPVYRIGPGLNAANMWGRGWLDMSRVWTGSGVSTFSTMVKLRPLHHRELDGYLAAQFLSYVIEFRMNTDWDAELSPCVLVHRFEGNRTYIVPNDDGGFAFTAGSTLTMPHNLSVLGSGWSIKVESIDESSQTATIALAQTAAQIPHEWPKTGPYRTPWVAWSEGDVAIRVGDRIIPVSATSGLQQIVKQVAHSIESETLQVSAPLKDQIRLESLRTISDLASAHLEQNSGTRSPATVGGLKRPR